MKLENNGGLSEVWKSSNCIDMKVCMCMCIGVCLLSLRRTKKDFNNAPHNLC